MSYTGESFQLPDGSMVATGNLPTETPLGLFAEFPDSEYLEDKDIERALPNDFYLEQRKVHEKYTINQSSIGKCNTSAAVSSIYQAGENDGHKHVPLADNHMYYNINGGGDNGSALIDSFTFARDRGCSPRIIEVGGRQYRIGDLVYKASQLTKEVRDEADRQAVRFKTWEPVRVPRPYSEFCRAVASAVARRYPLVVAWHVSNASMKLRNGFIQVGRGMGNHATKVHSGKWVGGKDLIHVDFQNSWGPTKDAIYGPMGPGWGDNGFGLMTMQDLYLCSKNHDFYILTTVVVDPMSGLLTN
jgi:hypothetical protein